MAINPNLRATGTVVSVEHIAGTSKNGQEYSFDTSRVLIGGTGLCDITLPEGYVPEVGEDVDWKVEVSAVGGNARVRCVGSWRG